MELVVETEKYTQDKSGEIVLLKLRGDFNQENLHIIEQAVEKVYEQNICKLIFDFEHVSSITSSGLGLLINFIQDPHTQDGIRLINMTSKLRILFDLLGLEDKLKIMDSKEEAMSSWDA